ncbi:uncharacterized protein LOC142171954 [Nicotiana tabacum]|uniref:Uncharacterized protein LOC142171954 n=1 Tax=Nicotiana tabacum TaxID=4097 RepID=A0AC58T3H7_TOBAC
MTQLEAILHDPSFSDHTPICLYFEQGQQPPPKPFKFFNNLADHKDFPSLVKKTWEVNMQIPAMNKIWKKMKLLKQGLKKLNVEECSKILEKIQATKNKLQQVQREMRTTDHSEELKSTEKDLKENLEKWVMVEESILKQKSRIQWLNLGDSNATFFHASIKNRNAQKKITRWLNQAGTYTQTEEEVQQEITQFYK